MTQIIIPITFRVSLSEALKLRIADITDDGLMIRETKFRKTRLVPLHDTAASELQRYLMDRRQVGIGNDHVFVGRRGRALPCSAVQCTFKTVLKAAGICTPPGRPRARLHDLRHSFAVRALQASPTGRERIGQHMVALATYLGHVNIYATYWYLEATADLLSDIARAGEIFMSGGAQP